MLAILSIAAFASVAVAVAQTRGVITEAALLSR